MRSYSTSVPLVWVANGHCRSSTFRVFRVFRGSFEHVCTGQKCNVIKQDVDTVRHRAATRLAQTQLEMKAHTRSPAPRKSAAVVRARPGTDNRAERRSVTDHRQSEIWDLAPARANQFEHVESTWFRKCRSTVAIVRNVRFGGERPVIRDGRSDVRGRGPSRFRPVD